MTVATTILEQLGGRRFISMTGARHFVGTKNTLSFRLPGNAKDGINCVRIELTPLDTYRVKFERIQSRKGIPTAFLRSEHDDIYADNLVSLFERITGLYTHL